MFTSGEALAPRNGETFSKETIASSETEYVWIDEDNDNYRLVTKPRPEAVPVPNTEIKVTVYEVLSPVSGFLYVTGGTGRYYPSRDSLFDAVRSGSAPLRKIAEP